MADTPSTSTSASASTSTLTSTSTDEAYMLGRGFRESARLHLQHWMWGERLGWQLHPVIEEQLGERVNEELSVVDIGCGNGVYLLSLAPHHPTWSFIGLDISPAQFPAPSYLPPNLTLLTHDAFTPFPPHLIGKFDILHLRAFCLVVPSNDPFPLAANLMTLLKPGGFIQWDEADCAGFWAHSPSPDVGRGKAERCLDRWQRFALEKGLGFGWVSELEGGGVLRGFGCEVLVGLRAAISDGLRKASTDNFLVALEEIGQMEGSKERGLMGREEWEECFRGLVEDVGRGVSVGMDMIVVVGRKGL